ncbi:hypothetical protein CMO96_01635 [Candidatus Woesebacteria bacterium]|nr:hypothetical protein [Candidatus Woesebacteria bacterium]|tara:strand:+ start:903 stop:1214 length:312 start_codon:yes stop_codon:yes gene_type:complete
MITQSQRREWERQKYAGIADFIRKRAEEARALSPEEEARYERKAEIITYTAIVLLFGIGIYLGRNHEVPLPPEQYNVPGTPYKNQVLQDFQNQPRIQIQENFP